MASAAGSSVFRSEDSARRYSYRAKADIDDVYPNDRQPRLGAKEDEELQRQIEANEGLFEPLLVEPHPDRAGKLRIIDGERRWTNSRILVSHGREQYRHVPVEVTDRTLTDEERLRVWIYIHRQPSRSGELSGGVRPPLDDARVSTLHRHRCRRRHGADRLGLSPDRAAGRAGRRAARRPHSESCRPINSRHYRHRRAAAGIPVKPGHDAKPQLLVMHPTAQGGAIVNVQFGGQLAGRYFSDPAEAWTMMCELVDQRLNVLPQGNC